MNNAYDLSTLNEEMSRFFKLKNGCILEVNHDSSPTLDDINNSDEVIGTLFDGDYKSLVMEDVYKHLYDYRDDIQVEIADYIKNHAKYEVKDDPEYEGIYTVTLTFYDGAPSETYNCGYNSDPSANEIAEIIVSDCNDMHLGFGFDEALDFVQKHDPYMLDDIFVVRTLCDRPYDFVVSVMDRDTFKARTGKDLSEDFNAVSEAIQYDYDKYNDYRNGSVYRAFLWESEDDPPCSSPLIFGDNMKTNGVLGDKGISEDNIEKCMGDYCSIDECLADQEESLEDLIKAASENIKEPDTDKITINKDDR